MKPIRLSYDIIEKGTYKVTVEYFDNDDIIVSVMDNETEEVLGYIDIVEEDDIDWNLNWN